MRERVTVDRPPPPYQPPPTCYCITITTGGESALLPAVLCFLTFGLLVWLLLQIRVDNERRRQIQYENQDGHSSSSYLDHGQGMGKRGVLSIEANQQGFCRCDLYSSRPEDTDGPSGSISPNSSLERQSVRGSPKPVVVESCKPFEMPAFQHVEELRQTHVAEQAEQHVAKSAAPLKKNKKRWKDPEVSTSDDTEQAERHLNESALIKKKKKGSKHPKASPTQDLTEQVAEQYVTELAYSHYLSETATLTTEPTEQYVSEPSYSYAAKERSKDPEGPTAVVTQQAERYLRESIPLETEQVEQYVTEPVYSQLGSEPAHSHTPLKKKKKRPQKDPEHLNPDMAKQQAEQHVNGSVPLESQKKKSKDPESPTPDGSEPSEIESAPLKNKKKRSKDCKAQTPDETEEPEQYVPESSPLKRRKKRAKDPKAPASDVTELENRKERSKDLKASTPDMTEQAEQHVNVSAHAKDPKGQKQRFGFLRRLW
ncbi:ankyrin repeat domain-containing protein 12-like isoform X2 [Engraulis encrasicolus]|uniref:ankyrin repeat domain-containing protein 12-like isoform X2 n=1 Tax=Engraulis encrasicolus TaxID=184585 RepID=UPI002FCF2F58